MLEQEYPIIEDFDCYQPSIYSVYLGNTDSPSRLIKDYIYGDLYNVKITAEQEFLMYYAVWKHHYRGWWTATVENIPIESLNNLEFASDDEEIDTVKVYFPKNMSEYDLPLIKGRRKLKGYAEIRGSWIGE